MSRTATIVPQPEWLVLKKRSNIFKTILSLNDTLRTRSTEKIVRERSQTQISKTETPNQRNSSFCRKSISLAWNRPKCPPPQNIFTLCLQICSRWCTPHNVPYPFSSHSQIKSSTKSEMKSFPLSVYVQP